MSDEAPGIIWGDAVRTRPPEFPSVGHTWYDTGDRELKIFNGADWVRVSVGDHLKVVGRRKGPKWYLKSNDEE